VKRERVSVDDVDVGQAVGRVGERVVRVVDQRQVDGLIRQHRRPDRVQSDQ